MGWSTSRSRSCNDGDMRRATTTERALVISGVVIAIIAVLIAIWPSTTRRSPRHGLAPEGTTSTSTTLPSALATTTTQITLTDTTRPLISAGATLAPARVLPTTIVQPEGRGPWPLIVFVHGYDVGPSFYDRYLGVLASHGFVVAAPAFPLEDPSSGYPLNEADIPNEATDVSFVIDSLRSSALRTRLVPGAIGVVGHSDGADVALRVGYDSSQSDSSVRAVVADAPDPIDYQTIDGGPPLELVHGSADQVVNPQSATQVMGQISAERWSVTLAGADHASPIEGPSPWTASFDVATIGFLDAVLVTHSTNGLTQELEALPGVSVTYAPGP